MNDFGNTYSKDEDLNNFVDPNKTNKPLSDMAILQPRIVVGPSGAGKYLFLRRQLEYASGQPNIFAEFVNNINEAPPPIEDIDRLNQRLTTNGFGLKGIVEMWKRIWYCAIITSVASHITHNARWQGLGIDGPKVAELMKNLIDKYGIDYQFDDKIRVLRIMEIFIKHVGGRNMRTGDSIFSVFEDDLWRRVQNAVIEALAKQPPIYVFIDSPDKYYDDHPLQWMNIQEGLLNCVCEYFIDEQYFEGHIKLFISLSENVLASIIRRSGNPHRISDNPSFVRLNWNYLLIHRFFLDRIRQQIDDNLIAPDLKQDSPLEAFLGHTTYSNTVRKVKEPLEQYILRHTRLVPYDIVDLGNTLIKLVKKSVGSSVKLDIGSIRREINRKSIALADIQLKNALNQLKVQEPQSDKFKAQNGRNILDNIIMTVGKDRFTWEELEQAIILHTADLGIPTLTTTIANICWQNGILGYVEDIQKPERVYYYAGEDNYLFELPTYKPQYMFHPTLVDKYKISAENSAPGIPWTTEMNFL